MKRFLLFFLTASLTLASNNPDKTLRLKKISKEIKLDGFIENTWNQADSVSDFIQYSPYHNKQPSYRTVAKVLTSDESIYCLMVCYAPRDVIQSETGTLDEFGGDVVSFMIDTFGDSRSAYKFAVSASGVKSDSRLLDDARNRDYNWDGIWFSSSKIFDWGFVVEMEIPYKSIQYKEELTEWGLDFDRWIPKINEDLYWCAYEENEGQRISKFGKLDLEDFKPSVKGVNLEIYPVGIAKASYLREDTYDVDPDAGLDIFYNPSPQLTFQATVNPDFAQIEADPFDFNISRFESYFSERRPFFTEGNEIFMPSGRQRNTGFYRPLEMFYSRRIGKKLPDGNEVPLIFGSKAFGRFSEWEYGGFVAHTAETDYTQDGESVTEPSAYFASARVKKQIFENSTIGVLFVGKHTKDNNYGVLDIDGALRGSDWQLAYQVARSFKNSEGDFALSSGFTNFKEDWMNLARARYIGNNFDIDQVGFVPWRGTGSIVAISGPRWYYDDGYIRSILLYGGGAAGWEKQDNYTDLSAVLGYNMQFRDNWGFELNLDAGKSKDFDVKYTSYNVSLSSWFNTSPDWHANLNGGYSKTYNFSREYLAFYSWLGSFINWQAMDILELGTSLNIWIEGNPDGDVEDITYNTRPYFSVTPINDLNLRVYVDNVFVKSTEHIEQIIVGFLFSYNFSPKSWIYFAINEIQDRSNRYDSADKLLPQRMHLVNRVGVFKIKYLYYF